MVRSSSLVAALAVLGLAGPALAQEAAVAPASPAATAPVYDPWQNTNRGFYRFNHAVDHAVIAPAIHGYMAVTPHAVRAGLSRAINNLQEPRIALNDILQGRPLHGVTATSRFLVNSTVGILGFIDVASKTGLPRHDSDFGQTLGRYGAGTGPYVFVPIAGPSNIRDGFGRIVDALADPLTLAFGGLGSSTFGNVRTGVGVVSTRADVDQQLRGLDRDFTDPYATLRSAYTQNRAAKVADAQGVTQAQSVEALPDFAPAPVAPAAHP
jgi:phospholipid-binding lipoprotein MlaA